VLPAWIILLLLVVVGVEAEYITQPTVAAAGLVDLG